MEEGVSSTENKIGSTYNFTIIKIPGTTNVAPLNLCTFPTILSPSKNNALAEKADPKV